MQHRLVRTLHDVRTRVRVQHVARHQGSRSCTGKSSTCSMNASDATGPLSRYGPQSVGRGDRITSSPSLRMNTSSVLNWNSFGNRTAWLRVFMNTLARRCMVGFLPCIDAVYISICHVGPLEKAAGHVEGSPLGIRVL